jgi:hypothetical protein
MTIWRDVVNTRRQSGNVGYRVATSLAVGVLCWCVSIFLASPVWLQALYYTPHSSQFGNRFHDVFVKQVANPLYRPTDEVNEAWTDAGDFLAYRIFVPCVAWLLGMGEWGGVAIIWLSGLLAAAVLYDLLVGEGVDSRLAVWFLLALGTTPFLQGSHVYVGFPDSVAWCCIAIMMRVKSPALWGLVTFIGLFNDERLCIALPLACAVAFYRDRANVRLIVRRAMPCVFGVAGGIVLAIAVRYGIKTGFIGNAPLVGNELPAAGGRYPWDTFHTVSLMSSYAVLWVLPLIAAVRDQSARIFWSFVAAYSALAVFVTTYAFDFWRGLGAIYPLFVLSFLVLSQIQWPSLRKTMMGLTLLMLLRPQFFSTGTVKLLRPLPIALYELYRGESVLTDLKARVWPERR